MPDHNDDEDRWLAVEAASHQSVMMLGKVRAFLSSHQSLCEARLRLQLGVRQAQTLSLSSSLSPLEVHLLSNQKVMEEHLVALDKASELITRQAPLAPPQKTFKHDSDLDTTLRIKASRVGQVCEDVVCLGW